MAIYERESEALKSEARKFNVYVEDFHAGDDETIYETDLFGYKWLRDERTLRRALRAARKESERHARERWGWRINSFVGVIGVLTALLGTLASSKTAVIGKLSTKTQISMMQAKVSEVESKIKQLHRIRKFLKRKIV